MSEVCITCNQSNFYVYPNGRRSCRTCHNVWKKKWWKKNPVKRYEKGRQYSLKRIYNLTVAEYQALLNNQDNRCLICQTPEWDGKKPHIDHDHKTNQVRGILCASCNIGLGAFKDNPTALVNAANYLTQRGTSDKAQR